MYYLIVLWLRTSSTLDWALWCPNKSATKVCASGAFNWRLGDEFTSKLIHFVGRIHFLAVIRCRVVVGWRSLFPCWLFARHCSRLLRGCSAVLAYGHLHLQSNQGFIRPFLCLSLCNLLCYQPEKILCFLLKGSCD